MAGTARDHPQGQKRADTLGARLRRTNAPLVLCHADLHTWNVLLDIDRRLWVVDWDETILAQKGRDLKFFVQGIGPGLVSPEETASFLQGYGDAEIDALALAYYRAAWAVRDIAAYGERLFFLPDFECGDPPRCIARIYGSVRVGKYR